MLSALAIPTALREFVPAGRPQVGGGEALAWAARVALVTLVVALALLGRGGRRRSLSAAGAVPATSRQPPHTP